MATGANATPLAAAASTATVPRRLVPAAAAAPSAAALPARVAAAAAATPAAA
ncbi:SF1 isoform 9 [Pan troglodytes]|uniref:Splicing factor 1 n=2 Tax=Homininae TaxID=207598 RepID=F8WEG7_HUMAN|nr:splicing factor 1 [Homo sapiens]KAI4072095.1 splicing factor 1 [Homo sapiens]PNI94011.1 SF1 isoform 9 [Pan troglodytes]